MEKKKRMWQIFVYYANSPDHIGHDVYNYNSLQNQRAFIQKETDDCYIKSINFNSVRKKIFKHIHDVKKSVDVSSRSLNQLIMYMNWQHEHIVPCLGVVQDILKSLISFISSFF